MRSKHVEKINHVVKYSTWLAKIPSNGQKYWTAYTVMWMSVIFTTIWAFYKLKFNLICPQPTDLSDIDHQFQEIFYSNYTTTKHTSND